MTVQIRSVHHPEHAREKEQIMGLQPKTTEEHFSSNKEWQLSDEGQQHCQTGTLDLTKFETDPAGGVILDGVPVVYNLATKLYDPAIRWDTTLDPDAYAQAARASGHVYEPVRYDAGETRVQFALFWHGRVKTSKVPVPTGHAGATFDPAKGAGQIAYAA